MTEGAHGFLQPVQKVVKQHLETVDTSVVR
jgi:hypothetical protein